MSLILDALRKSEAERRRGNLPALALELPPPAAHTTRPLAWWLAFPMAIVVGAAAFWLTRPDGAPAPASPPATTAQAQRVQPAGAQATDVWPDKRPAGVRPADARPAEVVTAEPAAPARPAPAAPPQVPMVEVPEPAVEQAPEASSGPVVEVADLAPHERRALPPLKLSMHMWSGTAGDSFVILDGHRLGEGDRAGNAIVERIDPDGVILVADGRRIRLSLP